MVSKDGSILKVIRYVSLDVRPEIWARREVAAECPLKGLCLENKKNEITTHKN